MALAFDDIFINNVISSMLNIILIDHYPQQKYGAPITITHNSRDINPYDL